MKAAGKSTFLRLLEEANPAYRVVSEPLTRWLQVPASEDVSMTKKNIMSLPLTLRGQAREELVSKTSQFK